MYYELLYMNDDTGQGEFGTKNNTLTNVHIRECSEKNYIIETETRKRRGFCHQKSPFIGTWLHINNF